LRVNTTNCVKAQKWPKSWRVARGAPRQDVLARRAKIWVDSGRRAARLARLARSRGSGGYLVFRSHSGADPPVGVGYRHSMTLLSHCVLQRAHAFSKALCAGNHEAAQRFACGPIHPMCRIHPMWGNVYGFFSIFCRPMCGMSVVGRADHRGVVES